MSKLFKLKNWLTLEGAATHLSAVLEEPVTVADILQLALDGHMALSVNFVNIARAQMGKIKPYSEAMQFSLPSDAWMGALSNEVVNRSKMPHMIVLDKSITELRKDTPLLCFDDDAVPISGIWDLAMIGSGRRELNHRLQRVLGGPVVDLFLVDGTYLKNEDGTYALIHERVQNPDHGIESDKKNISQVHYIPAGRLPSDAPMVIRTNELIRFMALYRSDVEIEQPLGDRERAALLNSIGALLKYSGHKESAIINSILTNHPGVYGLTKRTLESKFAEAKRSLTAR